MHGEMWLAVLLEAAVTLSIIQRSRHADRQQGLQDVHPPA